MLSNNEDEAAYKWFAQSAKEGNADAAARLNELGAEYQFGNNGRTINLPLAYKFYEASADCGNSDGMANAAYCLSNGIGVEKDFKKCFELYSKAAELGNQFGYSNLGWCYMYGNGTEKDVEKAARWLTRAAEECNNIWSMNRLTEIYGGIEGHINHEQAAKWFLELIKRDCDPNSGVYENTGYNKDLYMKIKNAILNSATEEEMMAKYPPLVLFIKQNTGVSLTIGVIMLAIIIMNIVLMIRVNNLKHGRTRMAKRRKANIGK